MHDLLVVDVRHGVGDRDDMLDERESRRCGAALDHAIERASIDEPHHVERPLPV